MRREDLHEVAQRIADQLDREEEARGGHDVSNEPRVPAGQREGGQWTSGGGGSNDAKARRRAMNTPHDQFFEIIEPAIRDLARRLGVDPNWILGVSALESGWYTYPDSTKNNNPFGIREDDPNSDDPDDNVERHFDSIDEAVRTWEKIFGRKVVGAKSADEFIGRLQDTTGGRHAYNSEKGKNWPKRVRETMDGVKIRQDIRAARGLR
jgi:hypothetical protein